MHYARMDVFLIQLKVVRVFTGNNIKLPQNFELYESNKFYFNNITREYFHIPQWYSKIVLKSLKNASPNK